MSTMHSTTITPARRKQTAVDDRLTIENYEEFLHLAGQGLLGPTLPHFTSAKGARESTFVRFWKYNWRTRESEGFAKTPCQGEASVDTVWFALPKVMPPRVIQGRLVEEDGVLTLEYNKESIPLRDVWTSRRFATVSSKFPGSAFCPVSRRLNEELSFRDVAVLFDILKHYRAVVEFTFFEKPVFGRRLVVWEVRSW